MNPEVGAILWFQRCTEPFGIAVRGVQPSPLLKGSKKYIFYTVPSFEFDQQKSAQNLEKHGIDFVAAQALWQDLGRVEILARITDENRFIVIGCIGTKHWSAVVTPRGDNIRIISVRRSRSEEVAIYESQEI